MTINNMKWKKSWILLVVGILVVLPYSHSEAQAVQAPLSTLQCDNLNQLQMSEMSLKEKTFSLRCDSLDAEKDWDKVYGNMTEHDLLMGVVQEP